MSKPKMRKKKIECQFNHGLGKKITCGGKLLARPGYYADGGDYIAYVCYTHLTRPTNDSVLISGVPVVIKT